MNRDLEVSYHEAGHAVCALLLGKSYGCHLHGAGDATGGMAGPGDNLQPGKLCDYTVENLARSYEGDTLKELVDDATITAGGGAAESLAKCEAMIYISTADRSLLSAACREAFPEADYQVELSFCNLASCRARAMLHTHYDAVERVALALHDKRSLSADEVARIYHGGHGGHPTPRHGSFQSFNGPKPA